MFTVQVYDDGYGKYYPIVTASVWNCFRLLSVRRQVAAVTRHGLFSVHFHLLRHKAVDVPEAWLDNPTAFFVLLTFWELGLIAERPG